MFPVHFIATYLPNQHEFNVVVRWQGKRLFEKMSIAKFLRFARQTDRPLKVQGVTITFDGEGQEQGNAQIRAYLKQVADSYVAMKYRNN